MLLFACRSMPARTAVDNDKEAPHVVAPTLNDALQALAAPKFQDVLEAIYVIGGGQVYADAIRHSACTGVHLTELQAAPTCDTFFPELDRSQYQLFCKTAPQRAGKGSDDRIVFKFYTRCALPASSCAHCSAQLSSWNTPLLHGTMLPHCL